MADMKVRLGFLLLLLSIRVFSQESTRIEKLSGQESASADTIPFELTDHNNISILAVVGGVDTLHLMFHTAANSITLTTKATEKMKSVHWDAQGDVGSWGGRSTARYSENNSLEIGRLYWDSLAVWEDEHSGPTTDGKFGPDLFQGYVIELDFDNNVMILHESLPKKVDDYMKMKVSSEIGDLFIEGTSSIGGIEFKNRFLVHSGYGGALLYDDKFAAESKIGERIEITDVKKLKDSFGNVLEIKKGTLPLFTIGNAELKDVPVGFFQGKIGRQQMSVLGADVLKRFNLIIDSDRAFLYLQPNSLTNLDYTQF